MTRGIRTWAGCLGKSKAGAGSDRSLASLLDGVVTKSADMLAGLSGERSSGASSGLLLSQDEWHLLDVSELRLAVLPAVKTLLSYREGGGAGSCNKQCSLFKGMDIGRGNPHEFQVAATSAADCCWECTERTPDYRGFVYNAEPSACYCKQAGPSPSQPTNKELPLQAGATSCCGQLWAAGEHVPIV